MFEKQKLEDEKQDLQDLKKKLDEKLKVVRSSEKDVLERKNQSSRTFLKRSNAHVKKDNSVFEAVKFGMNVEMDEIRRESEVDKYFNLLLGMQEPPHEVARRN